MQIFRNIIRYPGLNDNVKVYQGFFAQVLNFRLFRAIIYEVFCLCFTLFCKCKKKNVFAGLQKQKFF